MIRYEETAPVEINFWQWQWTFVGNLSIRTVQITSRLQMTYFVSSGR